MFYVYAAFGIIVVGLNRCAVFGSTTQEPSPETLSGFVISVAKAWKGCYAAIPLRKGAFYDFPSTTHDGRHAGAESRPEYANVLSATGLSVRAPFRKITGIAGPRAYPRLPGLLDQREETGARLRPHRGCGTAFPL